ncbi:hypothetical protein ABZ251_18770 [Streptomyces chartreusis]
MPEPLSVHSMYGLPSGSQPCVNVILGCQSGPGPPLRRAVLAAHVTVAAGVQSVLVQLAHRQHGITVELGAHQQGPDLVLGQPEALQGLLVPLGHGDELVGGDALGEAAQQGRRGRTGLLALLVQQAHGRVRPRGELLDGHVQRRMGAGEPDGEFVGAVVLFAQGRHVVAEVGGQGRHHVVRVQGFMGAEVVDEDARHPARVGGLEAGRPQQTGEVRGAPLVPGHRRVGAPVVAAAHVVDARAGTRMDRQMTEDLAHLAVDGEPGRLSDRCSRGVGGRVQDRAHQQVEDRVHGRVVAGAFPEQVPVGDEAVPQPVVRCRRLFLQTAAAQRRDGAPDLGVRAGHVVRGVPHQAVVAFEGVVRRALDVHALGHRPAQLLQRDRDDALLHDGRGEQRRRLGGREQVAAL